MTNGGEQNRMDRVRDGPGYTTLNNLFSLWKNVNFYLIRESNLIFKDPEKNQKGRDTRALSRLCKGTVRRRPPASQEKSSQQGPTQPAP